MSRSQIDQRILAAIGGLAVLASLIIGGSTSKQSQGAPAHVDSEATSQAASYSHHRRGATWD